MTPTYADLDTLRAALVAGQCETALRILDAITEAPEPEPAATYKQVAFIARILAEPMGTVRGWGLTLIEAKQAISALLDDDAVTLAGADRTMSQTFRGKQAKKSAIPW